MGCHFLLQGICPTQGSKPGLLHYRQMLYCLSHIYIFRYILLNTYLIIVFEWCFPGDTSVKEPYWQCRRPKRHGFDPWVGKIPWRKAQQPTPVFLPGKSQGRKSLVGYSPWGCRESAKKQPTPPSSWNRTSDLRMITSVGSTVLHSTR